MLNEHELEELPEPEGAEEVEESGPIPKALKAILNQEGNLLPYIEENGIDLEAIRERVINGYEADKASMKDYIDRYDKITKLASMKADEGDKTFPFQGASKVMMQYLAQAAIDFNSRTVPEVVNRKDIACVDMWGGKDQEKEWRGERVSSATNWWLKKGIRGWAKMKDRGLLLLPTHGMYFNKVWWSDNKINESLITANKMVYDHDAESFDEAPRKSHTFPVERNDYISLTREGQWEPIKTLEDEKSDSAQPQIEKPLEMIESHCTLDLDGDGYSEPYIVTWNNDYDSIVRIERRFHENDVEVKDGQVIEISGEEFFIQHGFIPSLDKPAVYDGWGTLLYAAFEQINTLYRQAIDANTLNITAMNSGFISTSLKAPGRSKSGRVELIMGQLSKVDAGAGQKLSDMIWTPQFQGMSQGFYALLENLKTEVMTYCATSQSVDVNAGQAASLYLAQLQQAMKVPNAIMSRVYEGLSREFKRLYDLQKRYMDDETYKSIVDWKPNVPPSVMQQYQQAVEQWQQVAVQAMQQGMQPPEPPKNPEEIALAMVNKQNDFADDLDLITSADPALGSREERLYRSEFVVNQANQFPQLYNQHQAHRNMLIEIGVPNVDQVLPEPSNQPDPMAEAQVEWTLSDAQKNRATAIEKTVASEAKKIETHIKARKIDIEEERAQIDNDKVLSETMENLSKIDKNEAEIALQTLDHARKDVEMELDAQGQLTQRQGYKVMDHPEHGEITEADIQQTMADNGMTRDEVMAALSGQNATGA